MRHPGRLFSTTLLALSLLVPGLAAATDVAWSPLFSTQGLSGIVFGVEISGSNVYAGGSFTTAGGTAANRIARWNGTSWFALGSGVSGNVFDVAVSGSNVYVGGDFTTAGGALAGRIARWNGSNWSDMDGGVTGTVFAVATAANGDVYVGGAFTVAGGTPANRMARWDGTSWSALGAGVSGEVYAIAVSGSDVYVGGAFTTAGGIAANRIARWNGSTWSALGSGTSGAVYAIDASGGDVYVGGAFTTAGGKAASRIARWNGSSWFALGSGLSNDVRSLAIDGSDVWVGGTFTTAGGGAAFRVAHWDGALWHPLGSGTSNNTWALDAQNGNVYVGGEFTTAGGKQSRYFGYWNELLTAVFVENISARPSNAGIEVAWSILADEPIEAMRIYRRSAAGIGSPGSRDDGGEEEPFAVLGPDARTFLDTSVRPGESYAYRIAAVRPNGSEVFSRWVEATSVPATATLDQNVPNPFNPTTAIRFSLTEPGHAKLAVFDAKGRLVTVLLDGFVREGEREVLWDGRDARGRAVASGVYFYRLEAHKLRLERKMILLK